MFLLCGLPMCLSLSTPSLIFFTCSICTQGKYCPTTCGVADYLLRYIPTTNSDLDILQRDLETIANLTQGADEKIVHMRDSTTSAQKSSPHGTLIFTYLKFLFKALSLTFILYIFQSVL